MRSGAVNPFGRRRRDTTAALVACQTCGFASPPGTPTCPYCGVDPAYRAPIAKPVAYDALGRPQVPKGGMVILVPLMIAVLMSVSAGNLWVMAAAAGIAIVVVGVLGYQMFRHYRSQREVAGTLREAEQTLDAALTDAAERWARLDTLHRHAPTGGATDATRTLDTARRVLGARIDALERARFDLRLVWWKNRVDLALARSAAAETSASETLADLTALRDEAARVLATLGSAHFDARPDVYADVRPRLDAARAALDTLVGRLFDASVAEAVAGITAPLDGVSVVRADVEAALDGLAAITAAAPAAARAADLTRESARLSLEADDLGDAPDTSGGGMTRRVGHG